MGKKILTILSLALFLSSSLVCNAKNNTDLSEAIKLYKEGNYTSCYQHLNKTIKKDSTNPLAYYYLAMAAAQVGKTNEAINNYSKTIALSSANSNLSRYAERGKLCLISPEKCEKTSIYSSYEEEFILRKTGAKITDEVRSEFERLKIEQLMREMNRSKDIDTQKFKEYKDFSSMDNSKLSPNNDEIVAAIKTLQSAGFNNILGNSNYSDLSLFTNAQTPQANIFNMMNNQNLSPQAIQMLLTNNMAAGF